MDIVDFMLICVHHSWNSLAENCTPQSDMIWLARLCKGQIYLYNKSIRSSVLNLLVIAKNLACFVNLSTIMQMVLKPSNSINCVMRLMVMISHGVIGIRFDCREP